MGRRGAGRAAGDPAQASLVVGYLSVLDLYLERRGLWQENLMWPECAIQAARLLGDEPLEGGLCNDVGLCYRNLGQPAPARAFVEQARAIRPRVGPRAGEVMTLNTLGLVRDDLGELEAALGYCAQALLIRREVGDHQRERGYE